MSILEEIIEYKKTEVAEAKRRIPQSALEKMPFPEVRDFREALKEPGMAVIAEVKRQSPSAGLIRADFDPERIAGIYETNGASAISVLTDEKYFGGHLDFLRVIRPAVEIPLLRKEFIVDPYQLFEARAHAADAVLLIVRALSRTQLKDLMVRTAELGMAALVEVHDAVELDTALELEADFIGVNNRNLDTFVTTVDTSLELKKSIPSSVITVSESGIRAHADLIRLEDAEFDAVLVGESLMRQEDIGLALRILRGT